jgi:hypothetical protein
MQRHRGSPYRSGRSTEATISKGRVGMLLERIGCTRSANEPKLVGVDHVRVST